MRQSAEQRPFRNPPSLWTQIIDLFLIELTNWRWSWRTMLLSGTIAPLLSITALGVFARDSGSQALVYVLTGNLVLALMFGNMDNVQSHFVFLRFMGGIDYFATLPIRRYALILAMVVAFLLISLPSLLTTVLLGALILNIQLSISPLILLVVPICAMSLAGIGALIGSVARNPQEAGSLSLLLMLVLLGLGPVIIPPDRLPTFLLLIGRLSPATYAASAIRQTLLGPVTGQLVVDLVVLVGLAIVVLWLTGRTMDWRQA